MAIKSAKIQSTQLNLDPPYLRRQPFISPNSLRPMLTDAERWRLVAAEPINKLARRTIQREVSSLNWDIKPVNMDDPNQQRAADYYKGIFKDIRSGSDFRTLVTRTIKSVCELPQGGAWEVGFVKPGFFGEGERGSLSFVSYIDAGTLHPTASAEYPIVQIDPRNRNRQQFFRNEEIVRLLASPYDEFDKLWWQESPTMASYMAIEALSRIYIYYLKQLHDTPVAGILDLLDFSEQDAQEWAKSFREMLEGIDPVKIPILYEHEQPAKWLPMGRNPSELSISEQFEMYTEIVLANYGIAKGDLRLFDSGMSKAGSIVSRKISVSGIVFYAELVKDTIQALLPPYLVFNYEEMDLEDARTKAMIRAADSRTIQTMVDLPLRYRIQQAKEWGVLTIDIDPDQAAQESTSLALLGVMAKQNPENVKPGQVTPGEGRVRNELLDDAKQNAASGTEYFAKSETEEVESSIPALKRLIEKAVTAYRDKLPDNQSKLGIKTRKAEDQLTDLIRELFRRSGRRYSVDMTRDLLRAVYTQFPELNVTPNTDPMQAKGDLAAVFGSESSQERVEAFIQKADGNLRARIDQLLEMLLGSESAFLLAISDLDRFIDNVMELLKLAYEDGMLAVAELIQGNFFSRGISTSPYIAIDFNVVDENVINILRESAAEMVRNIENGTKYYLRQMIIDGALRGDSVDTITAAIKNDLFGLGPAEIEKLSDTRIRSIVTTELNKADSMGRLEEMRMTGLTEKEWLTRGSDVCELCLANEAYGPVPLDFEYDDVFGKTLHPPGHPSTCHCTIAASKDELDSMGMTVDFWTGYERARGNLS